MFSNLSAVDEWWGNLSVGEKEHIASKAKSKNPEENVGVEYPECTVWWITLSEERKKAIYEHCTDKHGMLLREFQEGAPMSY